MDIDRLLKTSFREVSRLYDSTRAGYPLELARDVIRLSKIPQGGTILDIGCGSGKATKLFAEKQYQITALDLSEELINLAKENLKECPEIHFIKGTFEEEDFPVNSFDLIIVAQTWHWLNPTIRCKKVCRILKNFGSLAIFLKHQDYEKSDLVSALRKLYKKHCPSFSLEYNPADHFEQELLDSKLFVNLIRKKYHAKVKYNRQKYYNLIQTFSWVRALSDNDRKKLMSKVLQLIDSQQESFQIPTNTNLF